MQSYTFKLIDARRRHQACAVLAVDDDAHARHRAAMHLSASPYFASVEIRQGKRVVCNVRREELDMLRRPIG